MDVTRLVVSTLSGLAGAVVAWAILALGGRRERPEPAPRKRRRVSAGGLVYAAAVAFGTLGLALVVVEGEPPPLVSLFFVGWVWLGLHDHRSAKRDAERPFPERAP